MWHNLPPMNTTRCNFTLEFMNGHVYAIGGFDGKKITASAEKLNLVGQSWSVTPIPELSLPRSALKAVRIADHGIIRELIGFDGDD